MNEMETSGTSGEATGRPISPFELANGKNYLQGQLDSIVRRLAENESLVRSLGDMLATERERKLSATSSQTTVELGGSASGETVKRGTREDTGRLAEKTVTHESSGNGAVPMWTADSRKRKPSTKSTQHALPTGTHSRHAVEVRRERHSDTKEVLRLLREFPLRSKEVQHIRQELQKSRRHAAENAQYAAEYHERHEHLESQLRSVSGECEQLRAELVKAVHDSTEVDVAVMVADLQCSIVELQSDVAGLCGRAADAERKSAMADEENASLKKSLQAKDDEVLQQQRVIDRTAQELANCHHQLKKAAKAQKASASEADVWQQKFLSMTRDMRQNEALVNQHQAVISGLKNRVQAEDVNQHQKIVELEQALSSYQEQVQQLETEMTGSRSQVDTLQEQISNLCPRSAVECEKQRQLMQNNIQDLAASLEQDNLQHTQHMDAIAKLKTILQTSQTQVATLEAENQKLAEEKSQLCDEVNTTVEQMAGEHQRWQDETNLLKEKLASAEAALEQVQVENQALKEQCEASQLLEDVSLDARQLTQDLQTKCDEQSEKMRFSQLQSQLDEKTMEFNHTTAVLKEVNASNRDLRSALSATRADSKAKAESLRQAKLALEQEHTHGKQQLQEFLGNLQRVQAQLKGEGKEKKALTTRLQENEQELQSVQNKNVKLLKDLKDCRAALDDVHREKKSVASSLSRSEVECSELRESLTSKQSQLRQDRDEHLLHSRQLRHSLQAAKNKAEAASKRLQDATEALANAESRLKQRAAQVASLQEQLKTVRKACSERDEAAQLQLQECSKEKESALEKLSEASDDTKQLREQLSELSTMCTRLESVIQASAKELGQLFNLQANATASSDDNNVASLRSSIGHAARVHHELVQHAQQQHQQYAALQRSRQVAPIASCSTCTTRVPQLLAKLDKAKSQLAGTKQMLQASRRMLQQLANSSAEQTETFRKQLATAEQELQAQRSVAAIARKQQ